jgi:hypothetical protein
MGHVASTNPAASSAASTNNGLSDLMQTLTNENSPLLSTLSSPNIQSALAKAPARDIVELSEQAQQLQATDALFGISTSNDTSTSSLFSALASVGTSGGTSGATPGTTLSDQLAAYQGNQQTQEAQTLLGLSPTETNTNSLFDVFA